MTREQKYDLINSAENLEDLSIAILEIADENGMIAGRNKMIDAKRQSFACLNYNLLYHNVLTRSFGIRQQAMMLLYYSELQAGY